ncbi:hypothetical protein HU200_062720 [Digitaria exilis]|uniref:Uncharacterized protein n=1 Tax=Digitaria exilis TaxID=1010633 RepID=A0A835E0A5_9POAL|nr:hypothetical protein HU200_062720 [Digitaria exilis]
MEAADQARETASAKEWSDEDTDSECETDSSDDRQHCYKHPVPSGDDLCIYLRHQDLMWGCPVCPNKGLQDHVVWQATSMALREDYKKWNCLRRLARNMECAPRHVPSVVDRRHGPKEIYLSTPSLSSPVAKQPSYGPAAPSTSVLSHRQPGPTCHPFHLPSSGHILAQPDLDESVQRPTRAHPSLGTHTKDPYSGLYKRRRRIPSTPFSHQSRTLAPTRRHSQAHAATVKLHPRRLCCAKTSNTPSPFIPCSLALPRVRNLTRVAEPRFVVVGRLRRPILETNPQVRSTALETVESVASSPRFVELRRATAERRRSPSSPATSAAPTKPQPAVVWWWVPARANYVKMSHIRKEFLFPLTSLAGHISLLPSHRQTPSLPPPCPLHTPRQCDDDGPPQANSLKSSFVSWKSLDLVVLAQARPHIHHAKEPQPCRTGVGHQEQAQRGPIAVRESHLTHHGASLLIR